MTGYKPVCIHTHSLLLDGEVVLGNMQVHVLSIAFDAPPQWSGLWHFTSRKIVVHLLTKPVSGLLLLNVFEQKVLNLIS